ncbi:vascular endothelial growth factor receptor 1-like [Paramacrobiotus metropolitanus]|uniref:vascular endothelial growth factor receptor 1-like n=1 Tax=Paramacrobiotus metropolitanus TaxID=2943436 RepID=UPI002446088F|nr:vascular endothelial growth factor receptor 1-like [Paramacrobiotus metropolitanus]
MFVAMDLPYRKLHIGIIEFSIYLLLLGYSCAQDNDIRDRPVLSPGTPFIDTPAGGNFELKCRGVQTIDWVLPREAQRNDNKVTIDTINLPEGVVSTLTVNTATGSDTGRYQCKYVGSPPQKDSNVDEKYTRSIYVFVNDPEQLFLIEDGALPDLPEFITLNQGVPSIIACLPTYSNAVVELLGQGNRPLTEDLRYDPTIGFTVLYPTVFFSGGFTCRFKVKIGGKEKKADKSLHFYYFENSDPPVPHINTESVRHVTLGKDFSISCEVHIKPHGVIELDWTLPSASTGGRKDEKEETEDKVGAESGLQYRVVRKILTVRTSEFLDNGDYTCSSKFPSNTANVRSRTVYVKIYPGNSHVTLGVPKPKVEVIKGARADVYVTMDAHPEPRLQWYKNEKLVAVGQGRIMRVGYANMTGIQIVGAIGEDAGNYTLVATARGERDTANVTLIVNEAPTIEIISHKSKPFFMWNTRVEFICSVTAYPAPHVILLWAPCSRTCLDSGPDGGENRFVLVPNEQYTVHTDITGRYTTAKLSKQMIGDSGFLRCMAENNFMGSTHKRTLDQRVLITDVEEGFQATMVPAQPVQHENVTFVCKANNYEYSYAKWEKQPLSSWNYNSGFQAVEQNSGIRLATGDVDDIYSHVAILRMDKVQPDMEGQYRCIAGRAGSVDVRRSVPFELKVRAPTAPAFVSHVQEDVAEKNVDYQGRLELDCEATAKPVPWYTWTKDGRPVSTNGAVTIDKNGARLINAKFTHDDQGQYLCVVQNAAGEISKTWKVVGGVSYEDRQKNLAMIGGIVGGIFLIFTPIAIFCCLRNIKQKNRIAELVYLEALLHNDTANPALIDPNVPLTDQVALLPYDEKWEFPKEKLHILGKVLGSGQFGKVVKAEAEDLNNVPGRTIVAVKTLKETADIVQRKSLLGEIKIMAHIGQHLNVVNLLGAVTKNLTKGELYMLMEFCPNGSLREYLQRHQGHRFFNQVDVIEGVLLPLTDDQLDEIEKKQMELQRQKEKDFDGRILTTRDLICYAFQVSRGMEYLASHHVIHRDLAARNVLVADDNVVKICDFGLARQEYSVYTKKNVFELPVKWMAIECIYESVFSTESDVWSFGILLWELFTLGSTPYPGLNIDQDFVERVRDGYRMERPYLAPKEMYEVMKHCWEAAPKARPSFSALGVHLGSLLEASVRKKYIDLNIPYQDQNVANQIGSDYVNDEFRRRSQEVPTSVVDGHGPVNNQTYVPTYKVLPGHTTETPTKPKRTVRPVGAKNALDDMELQPMLSRSPNPSRPGNLIENEDYLNDQFVTIPVNRSVHNTAAPGVTYKPSFSDHSSGFHSDVPDDLSPVVNSRANYLFNQNVKRKPSSSEV